MPTSLEELLAIYEITRLSAVYARGLDRFSIDDILCVFTPDATFDARPVGLTEFTGTEAIREFFSHNQDVMADQIHLFGNFIVDLDGPDEAHGTSYLWQDGHTHDGGRVHTVGFNVDEYQKTDGEWLITRRTVHPLLPPQLEAY